MWMSQHVLFKSKRSDLGAGSPRSAERSRDLRLDALSADKWPVSSAGWACQRFGNRQADLTFRDWARGLDRFRCQLETGLSWGVDPHSHDSGISLDPSCQSADLREFVIPDTKKDAGLTASKSVGWIDRSL